MTNAPQAIRPDNTLVEAAGAMRYLDVGALPVWDDEQLAGMLTDRDMVVRAMAEGRDPNRTTVREVMSPEVVWAAAEQSVEDAAQLMEQKQLRRLPVLNREKRLVGMLSLADVAVSSQPAFAGKILRDVSKPSR